MPEMTAALAASRSFQADLPAKAGSNRVADLMMSTTFQLICALLIGVPLPDLLRRTYENLPDSVMSYDNSMIGTVAAVLFGYLIYRKVTSLPGTNALLNQLPGFIVSYLAVTALFFALRLDFSRQQFLMSFVFVSMFFWILTFVTVRVRRTTFGFVSGGKTEPLTRLDYVDWIRLDSPADADKVPHLPLVADFNHVGLSRDWERYIAEAAISGRRVFNAKQLKESLEGQVEIENLSENSFGHLAPDSIYAPIKLYIDLLQAIVALALLWPVMLIVAIAIRIDSKGPAIFCQKRMGFRGQPFMVYKFRSMNVTAPDKDLPPGVLDITRAGDQRITRVGRFIRKTRLDELPQLFNVLKGDMSWIGPRPETLNLSEWYETEIPFYRYRHIVRPGITGWAQIKQGHVTSVDDVRTKLEYDFYYVRNFSIWLDILIVIQTMRVILTGHGSK